MAEASGRVSPAPDAFCADADESHARNDTSRHSFLLMRACNCRCKLATLQHREGHQAEAEALYRAALSGYELIGQREAAATDADSSSDEEEAVSTGASGGRARAPLRAASIASIFSATESTTLPPRVQARLDRAAETRRRQALAESEVSRRTEAARAGLNLVRRDRRGTQAVVRMLAVRYLQRAWKRALRVKSRKRLSTVAHVRPDIASRSGQSVTTVGFRLFIFGGASSHAAAAAAGNDEPRARAEVLTPTSDFFLYGTDSDKWLDLRAGVRADAPWPPARAHHVCVLVGARLLLYGGYGAEGKWLRDAWQYDLQEGAWEEVSTEWPPPGATRPPPLSKAATDAPAMVARDAASTLAQRAAKLGDGLGARAGRTPDATVGPTGAGACRGASGGGGGAADGPNGRRTDRSAPQLSRASTEGAERAQSTLRAATRDQGARPGAPSVHFATADAGRGSSVEADATRAGADARAGDGRSAHGAQLAELRLSLEAMPKVLNSDELLRRRDARARSPRRAVASDAHPRGISPRAYADVYERAEPTGLDAVRAQLRAHREGRGARFGARL